MDSLLLTRITNEITTQVTGIMNSINPKLPKALPGHEDYLLINNSFIYRDLVSTKKSGKYLAIKQKDGAIAAEDILVVKPKDLNVLYKILPREYILMNSPVPLVDAINHEISELGWILFILIGEMRESECAVPLKHKRFIELRYVPFTPNPQLVNEGNSSILITNQINDPERFFIDLEEVFHFTGEAEKEDVREMLKREFLSLGTVARITMTLNPTNDREATTLVDSLLESAKKHVLRYKAALVSLSEPEERKEVALNEIMRISYNFTHDARKVLELLVTISDKKAIFNWLTLKSHYGVSEALISIPETADGSKPSMKKYESLITKARNQAFHNFFVFDRTIDVKVEGLSLLLSKLELFKPYENSKKNDKLDYIDNEILSTIQKFVRSEETMLPDDFWIKNLLVLESFVDYLESARKALLILREASREIGINGNPH